MKRTEWPIIVGGCYRSGTSLVRRILNAHSGIHCGPEVKFFRDFYGDYFDDPVKHLRFASSARTLLAEGELLEILGNAFIEIHKRAAAQQNKRRWADKNPENVLYLNDWQQLLGEGWFFVHIARNPLDTIASMHGRFPLTLAPQLSAKIRMYIEFHQAGLEFTHRYAARCIRVCYESLVTRPRETITLLMARLGESIQERQLDFNSLHHQPGLEDPKVALMRDFDPSRIGSWKSVLNEDEMVEIQAATSQLWKELRPEHGTFAG